MYSRGGPEMNKGLARSIQLVNEVFYFTASQAREGREIAEVERELFSRIMTLGREALQAFVDDCGTGNQGETTLDSMGHELPYVRDRICRYQSIFGEIDIVRAYYQRKGVEGLFPLDSQLNLPDRVYSYVLQEWAGKLAVNGSYEKAREFIQSIFPVNVPIRSVERIVQDVCNDSEAYYEHKEPSAPGTNDVVCVLVDCKGVVMRKEHICEERPSDKDPKKTGKKKMATVGTVYNIARHYRTVDDVLDERSHKLKASLKPKPMDKRIRGSLNHSKAETVDKLKSDVTQRLKDGAELVCLLDGERALWNLVTQAFPKAFFVLDIFHVTERLWTAAHCFHKQGNPEAEQFVINRLRKLLKGDVGRVIGGFKQMLSKKKLPSVIRYELEKVVGYLQNNKGHMRYDICLARGYPIGSGVVEGACRNLINDRMELTGMKWSLKGAEAMIRLRSVDINGDWEDFWDFHRKKERNRLYPGNPPISLDIHDVELKRAA
jgi:hypothetical protein